jgi:hypothetical protein
MRNAKKYKEEDLVLLFLTGLNDGFSMVRSQILLMEPFPQLNSVFGMVIQHESLNGLAPEESSSSALINLAKKPYNGGYGNSGQGKGKCTYCGKGGHIIDTCFKKHGYPPGFRFRDGTVVGKSHGGSSINNLESVNEDVETKSNVDGDNHVPSFSHEEYRALMALLKSSKSEASSSHQINSFSTHIASSSSNVQQGTVISASCFSVVSSLDTWILDSGATDHVCSSLSLFTKYHNVNPIPVKLPNGSIVTTDIVGDINVTQHITLHNVLYMPKFSFNLISISRVSLDLDCAFVFTDNLCYIQNSMQKMIGSGRQIDGLYYLEGTSFESSKTSTDNTCNSVVIPKSALWHFRFGHTSHDRLEAMQKL